MTELELTVEELETMEIRAVRSIEISDICLEMLTAQKDHDPERMAAAIARLEHLEATTGTAPCNTRGLSGGVPWGVTGRAKRTAAENAAA
jgi:hypothetical protein